MQKIKSSTILDKISEIKKANGNEFYTNYFLNKLDEEVLFLENEGALVFLQPEADFYHLYFATKNLLNLEELFLQIPAVSDIAIEIICKNKIDENLYNCINRNFQYQTTYERMKLYKIEPSECKSEITYAEVSDLDFVHNQLRIDFNKYFDHFPSNETLKNYIENKQVLVKKDGNQILCYLIFTITNSSCHFNYMRNLSNDSFLHLELIEQFYNEIVSRGAKNVYLWVDVDNNARVKKLHEYYRHKSDGTLNVTFLRKRL